MTTDRRTTCRYLKAYQRQCTAEAADPDAEILLCTRHMAAAVRAFQDAAARTAAGRNTSRNASRKA